MSLALAAQPLPRNRTRPAGRALRPAAEATGPGLTVRGLRPDDFAHVAREMDLWSRGRFLVAGLHRAFFHHFADTSLLLLDRESPAGVLIGYRSQSEPPIACVHHLAVGPRWRRRGGGRMLYEGFLALAAAQGCREVHAAIPPVSSGLIAFHRQLGFDVIGADGFACGIAVCRDYAGPGQHRVLFRRPV